MKGSRLLLAALLGLALLGFFGLDLGRYLTLDMLAARHAELVARQAASPVTTLGAYFLMYVAVTALSLPGAVILSLAGGALFGTAAGSLVVSFASSLGATLAFLSARHLFRDQVRQRFGPRLAEIDRGLTEDGVRYLLFLRLVPAFPFFVINLVMGLTGMRARTFYWVSQLGMLPATVIFVHAGTRLATLRTPGDILDPQILGALAAIGVFPLGARRVVRALRARRVYAPWRRLKPRRFDRNLIVIGGGAAGLVASQVAAGAGARVTLIEARAMGGDCLNHGCVPSKALIRTARLAHEIRTAGRHGLAGAEATIDFAAVMARVRATIAAIAPRDSSARYAALGVECIAGEARLSNPWTVDITLPDGEIRRLTTRTIVLATGATPRIPAIPGIDDMAALTSDTVWGLSHLPSRLLVLGAGPVGCELAQSFARLGARVTLVEPGPRILPREAPEAAALVAAALVRDGIRLMLDTQPQRFELRGDEKWLIAETTDGAFETAFDALLCATGRVARTAGFGLEALGIPAADVIAHDAFLATRYPNILVAGDAAGPLQFTHAAAHQAWHASVNALFGDFWRFRVDERLIPRVTFTDPEIASLGLTEAAAQAAGVAFELTRFDLADLDRAVTEGEPVGYVQVLTVPGRDRLLGVTIVGRQAGEMLGEFALAMRAGLGLKRVLATVHPYPTFSEANRFVAGQWQRAHLPGALLRGLARYLAWRRG